MYIIRIDGGVFSKFEERNGIVVGMYIAFDMNNWQIYNDRAEAMAICRMLKRNCHCINATVTEIEVHFK
jgi:hypothetical protein